MNLKINSPPLPTPDSPSLNIKENMELYLPEKTPKLKLIESLKKHNSSNVCNTIDN